MSFYKTVFIVVLIIHLSLAHRQNPSRKAVGGNRHRLLRHRSKGLRVQSRPLIHTPKNFGATFLHKPSRPKVRPSTGQRKTLHKRPSRPRQPVRSSGNKRRNLRMKSSRPRQPTRHKIFNSHYSHKKPSKPVCGHFNGLWKTFRNINEFNKQRKKGFSKFLTFFIHTAINPPFVFITDWQFHSYGQCPRPQTNSTDILHPICAQFNNEIRKFESSVHLDLDRFNSGKSKYL